MPETVAVDDFTYDDQTHVYRKAGRVKPHITGIMEWVGLTDYSAPWYTEEGRDWGTNLAACIELVNRVGIDRVDVDPRIQHEVFAYAEWRDRTGFIPMLEYCERPLYSALYGFCGTPDMPGWIEGQPAVIEIKRGAAHWTCGMQVAAQVQLVSEAMSSAVHPRRFRRFALHGIGSGTPKIKEFTDRNDMPAFLGAVAVVIRAMREGMAFPKPRSGLTQGATP